MLCYEVQCWGPSGKAGLAKPWRSSHLANKLPLPYCPWAGGSQVTVFQKAVSGGC